VLQLPFNFTDVVSNRDKMSLCCGWYRDTLFGYYATSYAPAYL